MRASPSSCRRSTPLAPESRGFPRSHRLTRDAELQAVRREGKRIRTGLVEVRVLASPLRHARVGLIVPKYRHGSVERNLVKRRLRELVRLRLLPLLADVVAADGPAVDAVIRAAPTAYGATFDRLSSDMARVARELPRLLRQLPPPSAVPSAAPAQPAQPAQPAAPEEAREEQSR